MKNLLFILLFPLCVLAQKEIQVSEDYTTILIFPSEIETQVLGNETEYFIKPSTNSSVSNFMLSLTYIKIDNVEKNTNLVVFTKDGNSYSFALKYVKKPNKLDPHYIQVSERSNKSLHPKTNKKDITTVKVKDSYYSKDVITKENNNPNMKKSSSLDNSLYSSNKMAYIESYCRKHNNVGKRIFKTYDKVNNIKITLKEISFNNDELYFHLTVSNGGGQTFDVDFINSKLTRDYKGVSTDQSIPLTPVFVYNKPSRVKGKSEEEFTMVYKKFSINDKKEFQIDLAEKEGERDLLLHISSKLINNPQKLK